MQSKKIIVKVATARSTKRLGQAPQDFKTLRERLEQIEPKLKTQDFQIVYTDNTGDVINVSDDEDLNEAYDQAQSEFAGQLKLSVQAREGELDLDTSRFTDLRSNCDTQRSTAVTQFFEAPQAQKSSLVVQAPEEEKKTEDQEMQINSNTIKAEIKDLMEKEDSEDTSSSDSQEEGCKQKRKGHKKGKGHKRGFKKMLRKQLEKQKAEIFEKLNASKQFGQEDEQIPSSTRSSQIVHANVQCDGCGVYPIVGPRFKCTIRKNFDYCSKCEDTKEHPHAFLKITDPSKAPSVLIAFADDDQPQNGGWRRNHGGPHGRHHGGPWGQHGGPGPWGGPRGCHGPFGRGGGGGGPFWKFAQQFCNQEKFQKDGKFDQEVFQEELQTKIQGFIDGMQAMGQEGNRPCGPQGQEGPWKGFAEHFAQKPRFWKDGQFDNAQFQEVLNNKVAKFCANMSHRAEGGGKDPEDGCQTPWRTKRATTISTPEEAVVAYAGKSAVARVEMRNNTPKPYAKGFVVRSVFTGMAALALEEVKQENDTFVMGHSNYFLNLPLNVRSDAPATDGAVAHFQVYGPGGNAWGEKVAVKFKVIREVDQEEVFRLALRIFEDLGSKENGLFEIVVDAVKDSNCDHKLALQLIAKKRYADDDDLYS